MDDFGYIEHVTEKQMFQVWNWGAPDSFVPGESRWELVSCFCSGAVSAAASRAALWDELQVDTQGERNMQEENRDDNYQENQVKESVKSQQGEQKENMEKENIGQTSTRVEESVLFDEEEVMTETTGVKLDKVDIFFLDLKLFLDSVRLFLKNTECTGQPTFNDQEVFRIR